MEETMKCYSCNSKLTEKNKCQKCGADVSMYKKIIKTSNSYYNLGLMKAQGRNLTGAAESLRLCLQLNKNNIHARNLLGLVYYEMGEAASALKEWVISKNIQYRNNIANEYIKDFEQNQYAPDSYNQTIKKFNQALETVREGNKELAVIQLKKVISLNPRMIKAYELLSLLYINEKQYEKAEAVLNRCLEIDKGNICAISYLRELKRTGKIAKQKKKREVVGESDREEVIVPVKLRDYGSYLTSAIYILIGVVLAIGVLYYLVIPTKDRMYASKNQETIRYYEEMVMGLKADINRLENKVEEVDKEKQEMEDSLATYTEDSSNVLNTYDNLLGALQAQMNNDLLTIVDLYSQINAEVGNTEQFKKVYETVKANYEGPLYDQLLQRADAFRDPKAPQNVATSVALNIQQPDYNQAISYYEACLKMRPEEPYLIFWLGVCYQNSNNWEQALVYYQQIIEKYNTSEFYAQVLVQMQNHQ